DRSLEPGAVDGFAAAPPQRRLARRRHEPGSWPAGLGGLRRVGRFASRSEWSKANLNLARPRPRSISLDQKRSVSDVRFAPQIPANMFRGGSAPARSPAQGMGAGAGEHRESPWVLPEPRLGKDLSRS